MYVAASSGDPDGMERYEAYLAERREAYRSKKEDHAAEAKEESETMTEMQTELKSTTKEGAATYVLEKARLSLLLLPPLSEEKKKARSRAAKELVLGVSIGKYAD